MRKQGLIILFLLLLVTNITGIEGNHETLQYISKPLLMPVLALFLLSRGIRSPQRMQLWILAALFFSWAGDVLLLFQERIPDFFLFGLSAFLLAHVFYIIFFHRLRVMEGIRSKIILLLPVALYYAGLIIWLTPWLGDMKLPVQIYGIVISFMLMLALHLLYSRNQRAGYLMVTGAVLFVISDSVLAINKFYQPFAHAGLVIMLTYGMAQLLIVKGVVEYFRTDHTK